MRDPIKHLQRLPWLTLLQVALVTLLFAVGIELLLGVASQSIPAIAAALNVLARNPLLGIGFQLAYAAGVGALAVLCLERVARSPITTGQLWGLVPCLLLGIAIAIPLKLLPLGWLGLGEGSLGGIIVGIFWKGQPYWRSFRRW